MSNNYDTLLIELSNNSINEIANNIPKASVWDTIIPILIGSFLTLSIQLVIKIFDNRKERKSNKLVLYETIIEYCILTSKNMNLDVQHRTNYYYNDRIRMLYYHSLSDSENSLIDIREVKNQLKEISLKRLEIEQELMRLDGKLSKALSLYLKLFGKDKKFEKLVNTVQCFSGDQIQFDDFEFMEVSDINQVSQSKIHSIMNINIKKLEDSFVKGPLNDLENYIKKKID